MFLIGIGLLARFVTGYSTVLPSLIDIVPVSVPTANNSQAYVATSDAGDSKIYLASGLPSPQTQVFVNALYCPWKISNDLRIFDMKGSHILSFSTGGAGQQTAFIKNMAGVYSVISSVKWSIINMQYLSIQRISVVGGLYATSGAKISRTNLRVPLTCDDTNTVYFYGISLEKAIKYSALDGNPIYETAKVVPPNDYAKFSHTVQVFNSLLVWFFYSNTFCIFERTTMGTLVNN